MIRRFWIHGLAALLALCAGLALPIYLESGGEAVTTIEIGGPFMMLDQHGRAITKQDLDQTPVALFAGFTHCPDVCPTTLLRLSNLMKQLGEDADRSASFSVRSIQSGTHRRFSSHTSLPLKATSPA